MTASRAELINAIREHAGALVTMSEELNSSANTYVGRYARGKNSADTVPPPTHSNVHKVEHKVDLASLKPEYTLSLNALRT